MEVPFLLSLIFSLGLAFLPGTLAEVTVRLKQGMIRGTKKLADLGTGNGVPYLAFTGIPYAKPPTGSRRFMRPEPIDAWEGVQGGQEVECAQEDTGRENIVSWGSPVRGQEDCLVINVYAPDLTSRRPVMVFIHGGGFFAGSGTSGVYGPDYLVAEDVVLVTVNYRRLLTKVGASGFSQSGQRHYLWQPGDVGFKTGLALHPGEYRSTWGGSREGDLVWSVGRCDGRPEPDDVSSNKR